LAATDQLDEKGAADAVHGFAEVVVFERVAGAAAVERGFHVLLLGDESRFHVFAAGEFHVFAAGEFHVLAAGEFHVFAAGEFHVFASGEFHMLGAGEFQVFLIGELSVFLLLVAGDMI
jgi:hypothetical protein